MRKKLTALFLTFCLALTPFASAFAANGEDDANADLVISTAEELAGFADAVNGGESYNDKLVVLDASIDLAGKDWTPIGTKDNPFKGTFDGKGFTVSNVTVNDADLEYAGLFGRMTNAVIQNVTVENVSIQAKSYAGGLIGDAFTGTVSNCHVTGAIQIEANYKVGGLAGNGYASFDDCSVTGADDSTVEAVYKETDLEGDSAGGLIGFRGEGKSTVSDCSVSSLSISGTRKVGGLIGSAYSDNSIVNCSVKDCSIATTATEEYAESKKGTMGVGGLIGCYAANSQSEGELSNCVVESVSLSCPDEIKAFAKLSYMVGVQYGGNTDAVPDTVENNMVTGENSGANVDSKDEVVSAVTPVARIGDTYYGTLQEAIQALENNDVLEIMPGEHDVTVTRTGNKKTYGSIFVIQKDNVTVKPANAEKGATLYGFTNEYNDGFDNQGISGQATVYVSGENVRLEGLTILPLGGYKGGDDKDFTTKTVGVGAGADGFTMTGCTTAPNEKKKGDQGDHTMMESAGLIHVSADGATLEKNSFGKGTTVAAGWADDTGATFHEVNASANYWGEGVTAEEIAGKLDGPVKLESYYSDADMQEQDLVLVGDYFVTNSKQLQDAINAAKDEDVIICAPGTYDKNISFNGKSVTVKAQYPAYTAEDDKETDQNKLSKFTGTFNTSEGSDDANFKKNQTVVIEGFAFSGDGLKVGNTNYNTVGNLEVRNCTMEFGKNLDKEAGKNYSQYNYFVKVSGNSGEPYASVTVEENYISGTPVQAPFGITPIQLWDVKEAVVRNNHIALESAGASQAINISMLDSKAKVTVTGNKISGAGAGGIYVTTWKLGGNITNAKEQFEGTITVKDNVLSNVLGGKASEIFIGYEEAANEQNAYGLLGGTIVTANNTDDADGFPIEADIVPGPAGEEPILYTASFVDAEDDTFYGSVSVPVNEDGTANVTLLEAPEKEGYKFVGWQIEGEEEILKPGEVKKISVQDDIVFVALWQEITEEPDDDHGGGTIVPSIDRGPSLGSPLPVAGSGSTPSVTGFTSDTNADLTVNGRYQFRITSLDSHTPVLTVNNANFTVSLASRSGNDYFYVITCAGTPGSTAAVSVDGKYLLTATVGGSASGVVSDTTHPFTVAQGGTYQFRLTAAARPSFAAGSASFTVEYAGQEGNDYFYKVHAVGQAGDGCGFYINGEAQPVAVATIA